MLQTIRWEELLKGQSWLVSPGEPRVQVQSLLRIQTHVRAVQQHSGSSAIWCFRRYPHKRGCVALGSAGWRHASCACSDVFHCALLLVAVRCPLLSVVWVNWVLAATSWQWCGYREDVCCCHPVPSSVLKSVNSWVWGNQVKSFGQLSWFGRVYCFLSYLYPEAFNFLIYLSTTLLWIK